MAQNAVIQQSAQDEQVCQDVDYAGRVQLPLETVLEKSPSVARNPLEAMAEGLEAKKALAAATDMLPSDIAVHVRLSLSAVATA